VESAAARAGKRHGHHPAPSAAPPAAVAAGVKPMGSDHSVRFFDKQFEQQIRERNFALNPFELTALPYLQGRVLDFGCGLGNLAFKAAERGCSVLALDASVAAVAHIERRAASEALAVQGVCADLRSYAIAEDFDAIVSIGLLMFFDCATALATLGKLQARVRPGGIAVVNVLVEGTTYRDMFGSDPYCLFGRSDLQRRFQGWDMLRSEPSRFDAPHGTVKVFETVVARKPGVAQV
jgi:tellurite methyltransferase